MRKLLTNKWLLRGFALFLLLALAVLGGVKAPAGLAQSSGESNADLRLEQADGSGVLSLAEGSLREAELAAMPEVYDSPLTIPAADFRDDGYDPEGMTFWFGLGRVEGDSAHASGCVMAPAYLPDGASIFQMWSTMRDNTAPADMWANLYRVSNITGLSEIMASINTTGINQPTIVQPYDLSITNPIVDYPSYNYFVGACLFHEDIELY